MGYFEESRTAFPDQRNELLALHHADDAVLVEGDRQHSGMTDLRVHEEGHVVKES